MFIRKLTENKTIMYANEIKERQSILFYQQEDFSKK